MRKMMLFAMSLVLMLQAAALSAQPVQVRVDPQRVRIKPGQSGNVSITPTMVPEGATAVSFSIDWPPIHGRGVGSEPPFVVSHRSDAGFLSVQLPLQIDGDARAGDVTVTLNAEVLMDGQTPGQGSGEQVPNAFVIEIAGAAPAFRFDVPPAVDLAAGQEVSVPLRLSGSDGWEGSVDVVTYPPTGITFEPSRFSVHTGEEQVVTLRVAPDAPPSGTLTIQAQTSEGGQLVMKEFRTTLRVAQPAATPPVNPGQPWSFELEPASIELQPGEEKTVELRIHRSEGFTNGVALSWQGYDPRVEFQSSYEQSVFQMNDSEPRRLTFKAAPNAASGTVEMTVTGIASGEALQPGNPSATLQITIGNKPPELSIHIDPDEVELRPGERKSVHATITGEHGRSAAIHVLMREAGGFTAEPDQFEFDHLPASFHFDVVASPTARADANPSITLKVVSPQPRVTLGEETLRGRIVAAETQFAVTAAPSRLAIRAGQSERFTLKIDGNGGPLQVSIGGSSKVEVHPDRIDVPSLPFSQEVEVRAKADAAPTEGFEPSLIVKASSGGSTPKEAYVALQLLPDHIVPAFDIQLDRQSIQLAQGEETVVKLTAHGRNGWSDLLRIEAIGDDEAGVSIFDAIFAIGARGTTRDIIIRAKKDVNPYPFTAGKKLRFKAYVADNSHGATDEVELAISITGTSRPAFEISSPTRTFWLDDEYDRQPVEITAVGTEGWNGVVRLRALPHGLIEFEPSEFELDTSNPSSATRTVEMRLADFGGGNRVSRLGRNTPPVVFEAIAAGGTPVKTLTIGVDKSQVTVKPPHKERPGGGNREPGDPGDAPLPPPPPVPTGGELNAAIASVAAEYRHFNSLDTAIERRGTVISDENAQLQLAFLKLSGALLQEAAAPSAASLPPAEQEAEAIAASLARDFAMRTGIFAPAPEAARRRFEIASMGMPMILATKVLEADMSELEMVKVAPGQPVDWSFAQNRVELLVLQMRAARALAFTQSNLTEPSRSALGAINDAIDKIEEKLGTDKAPVRLKAVLKHLTIATALVTTADIAAKAGVAFLPNQITGFYTVVDGQRREEGDDAVVIRKGSETPVQVFIETRSPGGSIVTPSEIVEMVWGKISSNPKVQKRIDDTIGTVKLDSDDMKEEIRKEVIRRVDAAWKRVTNLPPISRWIDEKFNKALDVAPFQNPPIEVNSNRVLKMTSLSERVIEIVEKPRTQVESTYFLKGIAASSGQAGYFFGLKDNLRNKVLEVQSSGVKLNVKAVVEVRAEQQLPKRCEREGERCCYLYNERTKQCEQGAWGVIACDEDNKPYCLRPVF